MRNVGVAALTLVVAVACASDRPQPERLARTSAPLVFTNAKSMSVARREHSATRLNDGRVLVAGGGDGLVVLSTAEVFDPATGEWTSVGPMNARRWWHTATLLASGKVLLAGGHTGDAYLSSADLFDPTTNTFTPTKPMAFVQRSHGAARLADGRVLLAGGYITAQAQIYNAATDTWTAAASMSVPRYGHGIVTLPTGKVLVGGGGNGSISFTTSELYDPTSNTWSPTGAMPSQRDGAYHLAGGKAWSIGGWPPPTQAWVYDPAAGSWSVGGTLAFGAAGETVLLADGRFLQTGVYLGGNSAQIFDPTTGTAAAITPMNGGRSWHTLTLLTSGNVLVAGGATGTGPVSTAEIFALTANGGACTATKAAECASEVCRDGVCCNSACDGACQACDVAGSVGTCTNVASGPPHGGRTCSPYGQCAAGACVTTCSDDAACASTHHCVGGACVPKKVNGTSCAASRECTSGYCVDGYCCGSACSRPCEACDEPGKLGACVAIAGYPHGTRPACTGTGVGAKCGAQCNGVDPTKCNYPTAATPCSANVCKDGIETHGSNCNGVGLCNDTPKSCGAYACGTTACKTTCTAREDCAAGYFCEIPSGGTSGSCAPTKGLGTPCTDASSCGSGFCADGVCCGVASCGAGSTCAGPGDKSGKCTKSNGTPCAAAVECASGACVDGVCCDSACGGQCQACDVKGSEGKCVPVTGAPHGGRTACDDGGAETCKALACDGSDPLRCNAFAFGPERECAPAKCAAAIATPASRCDGKGACSSSTAVPCAPFGCAGDVCRTSCTNASECAPGNTCSAGACVPGASCTGDRHASIGKDGVEVSCTPYLCQSDGNCASACRASLDCAGGYVCDPSGRCIEPTATADEGGGCSTSARSDGAFGLVLIALGLVALTRRRGGPIDAS